jgi:hypothetical protein
VAKSTRIAGWSRAGLLRPREPVLARHHHVGKENIDRFRGEDPHRLERARRGKDTEALTPQQLADGARTWSSSSTKSTVMVAGMLQCNAAANRPFPPDL